MIFETLAAMADRANDNKDNYNSTPQQAKAVLQDVQNTTTPKGVIYFATSSGDMYIDGDRINEYKHYLVGMQRKQPQSVIQANIDSSSSSSSSSTSSSSSDGTYVPSLQCAGGTEPSMVLTITGASGTVNWCGLTWNLPADSGLSQEVCPTYYEASKSTGLSYANALNEWRFLSGDRLDIARRLTSNTGSLFVTNIVALVNSLTGIRDYRAAWYTGSPRSLVFSYRSFSMGLISAVPDPTINDYRLTDAFFGSHTVGGVTFTWARGTNW